MRRKTFYQSTPFCPFCRAGIVKPRKRTGIPLRHFPCATCRCGAVYVSDLTGKNGGEALLESLALACNDNEEQAWSLTEGEDYALRVMSYDTRKHLFNKRGHFKDGMARLYFVKLTGRD
jgi:hypothetical protein